MRLVHAAFALLALTALSGEAVYAQMPQVQRPYRGLFGGNPNRPHSLDLTAIVNGGWDDNATMNDPGGGVVVDPRFRLQSWWAGLSVGLSYGHHRDRWSVSANAATTGRYYVDQGKFSAFNYSVAAGLSAELNSRTTLQLTQTAAYLPYYQLGLFQPVYEPDVGELPAVPPDLALYDNPSWRFDTAVGLSRELSRRSDLSVSYNYGLTNYERPGSVDASTQSAGARYSYSLTAGLALRVGYRYTRGNYVYDVTTLASRPVEWHDIDTGLSFGRALSISRKTTVSFSVGSSLIETVQPATGDTTRRFDVVGNAGLTHQFGRSWALGVFYNRGVGFPSGLAQPTVYDAVSGRLSGLLTDRSSCDVFAGWSSGTVGVGAAASNPYDTAAVGVGYQYALTANLAATARYTYYRYFFENGAFIPPGMSQDLGRNSVWFGLSVWVPLLR